MTDDSDKKIRVFVYGTLKFGHGNWNYLLRDKPGVTLLGSCWVDGPYRMLHLGGFPGVIQLSPQEGLGEPLSGRIYGEVFQIDLETLDALDMLEGNGSFFTRERVWTPWKNAWMYMIPEEYKEECSEVESVYEGERQYSWRPTEQERQFIEHSNKAVANNHI